KQILLLLSLHITIFLIALDRTSLGPALPTITNHFNSLSHLGWYISAYTLTSCAFILPYARLYTFFSTKFVFLSTILLFEIGSAVSGAARSSTMLIVGRAVSGVGSAGIFTGTMLIVCDIVPLKQRPLLQGLFGVSFGVGSILGPVLGGAFTGTQGSGWRWCFWINLPLGALVMGVVLCFLGLGDEMEKVVKRRDLGWRRLLLGLDPGGTVLLLLSVVCLLLGLGLGGARYAWSSPVVVGLLVAFGVLFVGFVGWQWFTRKTTATIPSRILFSNRSVIAGMISQFSVGATMLTVSIYVPLWFQAITSLSALESGIRTLPLVISVVTGTVLSGALVQKTGYYTPFMILGSVLMSIGAGLLTTWHISISSGAWIGYQCLLGLGLGFTLQHSNLAIQIVLPKDDIPTGTALLSFSQTLGGAVFVAVGQNTFIHALVAKLSSIPDLGFDPAITIRTAGATSLIARIPDTLRPLALQAYNTSLTKGPFLACAIIACFAVPAALAMEWRTVREDPFKNPEDRNSRHQKPRDEEAVAEPVSPISPGAVARLSRGPPLPPPAPAPIIKRRAADLVPVVVKDEKKREEGLKGIVGKIMGLLNRDLKVDGSRRMRKGSARVGSGEKGKEPQRGET
ncbi:major facilitator superfamily domain-containing protein, partial [Dendryphion nanum]